MVELWHILNCTNFCNYVKIASLNICWFFSHITICDFHLNPIKTGLIYNLLRGGGSPYKFSILKTFPMAINVMFILPSTYIYKHFQELLVAGIIIFCRLWYKCIFKVTLITIHLESHGQINRHYHDNCHNLHFFKIFLPWMFSPLQFTFSRVKVPIMGHCRLLTSKHMRENIIESS